MNLCIGTAQIGSNYGVSNELGVPDDAEVEAIVQNAMESGIHFFDTAQGYGNSELRLGRACQSLSLRPTPRWITKLNPNVTVQSEGDFRKQVQSSIDKLCANHLWGLMLHRPVFPAKAIDFLKYVRNIKESGLIKNFGVSVYSPEEALEFLSYDEVTILQIPTHVLDRRFMDANVFSQARSRNVKVFCRSIFLQGLLLMSREQMTQKEMGDFYPYVLQVRGFARAYNIDIKTFCLKTITQTFPEIIPVMGVACVAQLREIVQIYKSKELEPDIIREWWESVPNLPIEFLNPALWKK